MRTNKIIDATYDEIENAKQTAVALIDNQEVSALDLFFTDNLKEIETGLKNLNELSNKSWILSAILLYTLIYNKDLYKQSGLDWAEYSKQSRERIGIDQREISEQLSAARFFIKYHNALERYGWRPTGSNLKLARAELALELSGDIDETLKHIANDTWTDFKSWYSSFKTAKFLPTPQISRDDIEIKNGKFFVKDKEAIIISDELDSEYKEKFQEYIEQIFTALKDGSELAIVPVYDKREASIMPKLRDRFRQGR